MRTKDCEVAIIIELLSGKSAALGETAITIPKDMEINSAIEEMIKKQIVNVQINEVKCVKGKQGCFVSFLCEIKEMGNAVMVISYIISDYEYNNLNAIFKKQKNLKFANSQDAVVLIKQIVDKYDQPFIQIAEKE